MSEMKKKVLKNKGTREGKEVDVAVERPSHHHIQEAQIVHGREFRKALENKVLLRECLEKHLREQGLWDDARQAEYEKLTKTILEGEKALARKNIKLSKAKQTAFDMQDARVKLVDLLSERRSLEANTVQAQAENARFNFLVSVCTVYNDTGKKVFSSVDDYFSKATTEYGFEAAQTLAQMLNDYDPDAEKKLPENAFLLRYGFVNDKLKLVNKEGKLIDRDGRLVNEDGRFVNEVGEFIDKDGCRVDEEGNYVFENAGSFLDDDGNPIPEPQACSEGSRSDSGAGGSVEGVKELVG